MYGGYSLQQWVRMFIYCHNTDGLGGVSQWCFPNGKSLLEQNNYTIEMFDLIRQQQSILLKQKQRTQHADKLEHGR